MFQFPRSCVAVGLAAIVLSGCAVNNQVSDQGLGDEILRSIEDAPPLAVSPGIYVDSETGARVQILGFDRLEDWREDAHGEALGAFLRSCERLERRSDTANMNGIGGPAIAWKQACATARSVSFIDARTFFETAFVPVQVEPGADGLFTAYFEPELPASRTPQGRFQHPIYATPPEIVRVGREYGRDDGRGGVSRYYSRGMIDDGALSGRNLEIGYLEDPVDLFFLHIQGSGRLRWIDGGVTRVGFAAKNGQPYRSVGQSMLSRGWAIGGDASARAIKALYQRDPARGRRLLADNPSYIFFRELAGLDPDMGPIGAMGVQLTEGRSVAVDRAYVPLGAPVWLDGGSPIGSFRRLMVAQDVGSAILGPQRADVFWGVGAAAGEVAGRMKHPGALTILVPVALAQRFIPSS